MSYPLINPSHQWFDTSGAPLVSGTMEFQNPTTSAKIDTFPTADDADAQTNANANPLTLDSRGGFTGIYLENGVKYKIIIKDSLGATVDTQDDVRCPDTSLVTLAGELSDLTDVNTSTPTNRNVLVADGVDWESRALVEADISDIGTYLENVVEDTTPELGGALDGLGQDLQNMGVLFLTEQASAETDVAGKGQFWTLTATPNLPMYTGDDGVDRLIDPSVSEINVQNGDYTTVLADAGKTISKESGGAGETLTIDSNANVAYKVGTFLAFNNDGSGSLTIAITSDTLVWADDDTTGSRTLADGGYAVAQKVATTKWKIAGRQLT